MGLYLPARPLRLVGGGRLPQLGLAKTAGGIACGADLRTSTLGDVRASKRVRLLAALLAITVVTALSVVFVIRRDGQTGGTFAAGDVSVSLPAGSLPAGTEVVISRGEIPANWSPTKDPGGTLQPVSIGQAVIVETEGQQPVKPASLTMALPSPPSEDRAYVVMWEDGEGGWSMLPTTLSADNSQISATLTHFSSGFLAYLDLRAWAQGWSKASLDYLTGRSGVPQPECGPKLASWKVTFTQTDTVKWCAGQLDGRGLVKIANDRRMFTQITYPSDWTVLDAPTLAVSVDAISRQFGTLQGKALAPPGYTARILDGGDTLTLQAPSGEPSAVTVRSEFSTASYLTSSIAFGLGVYFGAKDFAADALGVKQVSKGAALTSENTLRVLLGEGQSLGQGKEVNEALSTCSGSLRNEFKGDPNQAAEDLIKDITQAMFLKCLPGLMKADPSFAGLGIALSAVVGLLSVALSAVNLVVTGSREVWDSIAGLGGLSSSIFTLRIGAAELGEVSTEMPSDRVFIEGQSHEVDGNDQFTVSNFRQQGLIVSFDYSANGEDQVTVGLGNACVEAENEEDFVSTTIPLASFTPGRAAEDPAVPYSGTISFVAPYPANYSLALACFSANWAKERVPLGSVANPNTAAGSKWGTNGLSGYEVLSSESEGERTLLQVAGTCIESIFYCHDGSDGWYADRDGERFEGKVVSRTIRKTKYGLHYVATLSVPTTGNFLLKTSNHDYWGYWDYVP